MRLPRGYKIETHQTTDERGLCDTKWRATGPGGENLRVDGMQPGDAETCIAACWDHAIIRWASLAGDLGLRAEQAKGASQCRMRLGKATIDLYENGNCSFGGPEDDRRDLANKLREAGLLRGHDRAAHGGGWDLPA